MAVADKYTLERKKIEIYSDFHNSFEINPLTGFLARTTNEEAVRQSVKNILLTDVGERFYDSNKGSKLKHYLFENVDPMTVEMLKMEIRNTIAAYEPRAIINDVRINENVDGNSYDVTIVFSVININDQLFDLSVNIKRVR